MSFIVAAIQLFFPLIAFIDILNEVHLCSLACFFSLSFMMCILVIQNLCSTFAIVTTVH